MDYLRHLFTSVDVQDIIRVGWAALGGGLIGLERELRDKAAGFRTLILIAVGAALFTIMSVNAANADGDQTKLAGYIVSGVGFLGAGAIMRDGLRVAGLTTAATIWVTAAIGMAFGFGETGFGILITAAMMIVLWIFPYFEGAIDRSREQVSYDITFDLKKTAKIIDIETALKNFRLRIVGHQRHKKDATIHCHYTVVGKPAEQEKFIQFLLADKDIKEFRY